MLPEFLTDTLILFRPLQTAGAITAGTLQAFPDASDHFLVLIQSDSHKFTSLPHYYKEFYWVVKNAADSSRILQPAINYP